MSALIDTQRKYVLLAGVNVMSDYEWLRSRKSWPALRVSWLGPLAPRLKRRKLAFSTTPSVSIDVDPITGSSASWIDLEAWTSADFSTEVLALTVRKNASLSETCRESSS